ncbi:hypothetical protein CEXT_372361 [Caerostris extrusa]|uniref:Uncharacterized protein n=1 Tax=Caerostris extrusa TaxID=172846 RepID=A0AAV4XEA0_CAEEX|nr:hypothetical protein CEXT_372361 [Caerostris extrusa]
MLFYDDMYILNSGKKILQQNKPFNNKKRLNTPVYIKGIHLQQYPASCQTEISYKSCTNSILELLDFLILSLFYRLFSSPSVSSSLFFTHHLIFRSVHDKESKLSSGVSKKKITAIIKEKQL